MPELAVPPVLPAGRPHQRPLGLVELGGPLRVRPHPFGHAGQRRPDRPGQRSPLPDRLEELHVGAVEVGDDRGSGPATPDRVVLRGQVMQVEDVGAVGPGVDEGVPPRPSPGAQRGRAAPPRTRRRGRPLDLRRRGASARGPRPHSLLGFEASPGSRVVQVLDIGIGEERRRMGLLARLAERSGHERDRPVGVDQGRRQVAHDLGRPAAWKEEQAHHDVSLGHVRDRTGSPGRSVHGTHGSAAGRLRSLVPRAYRGETGRHAPAPRVVIGGRGSVLLPVLELGGIRWNWTDSGRTEPQVTDSCETAGPFRETMDIFEGTEQIQQLVISRAISGLRIE